MIFHLGCCWRTGFSLVRASLPRITLLAILLGLTVATRGAADEYDEDCSPRALESVACAKCDRPNDEVWVIGDRHSGCLDGAADVTASLRFKRYDMTTRAWHPATDADFFGGPGADRPACYWVHGDRIDSGYALDVGLTVYRRLVAGQCDAPPMRFVIWSWPTSQVYRRRPVQDVRLKASRTPATGFRLATVLAREHGGHPVGLVGYSFGSRVVTGALTALSGGELAGRRLEKPPQPLPKFRAALLASATDNDWLEPDQPHGLALKSVDRMLLVNNACDRVLAHYHLIACGRHGPPALGACGVASLSALGPDAAKIRQIDACCEVGKYHRWHLYVGSDSIMRQVRETVLP